MNRRRTWIVGLSLVAGAFVSGPPAGADEIRQCVTYDFAGSELCVGQNGLEGADRFTPWDEPEEFCVIYTFSGAQICVNTDGEIHE